MRAITRRFMGVARMADCDTIFQAISVDPYGYFDLQRNEPIFWDDDWGGWVVTGYDEVRSCLNDRRLSARRTLDVGTSSSDAAAQMRQMFASWLVFLDPPDHTRLRGVLAPLFTRAAVARQESQITSLANELIDAVADVSMFDLVRMIALPLPGGVISQMLAIPAADREHFVEWADDIAIAAHSGERDGRDIFQGFEAMNHYLRELADHRADSPGDDLISQLLLLSESVIDRDELIASAIMLLIGGIDTTRNQIANSIWSMSSQPDMWQRLVENPDLSEAIAEECLRHEGASRGTVRLVGTDHSRGSAQLRTGEKVLLLINAANRDPAQYDSPSELRCSRPGANTHLAFGYGRHYCLGAHLARLELRIILRRLAERLPGLRVQDQEFVWDRKLMTRGLVSLMVAH